MNLTKLFKIGLFCVIGSANATVITYNDFSSTAGLTLNGDAQVVAGNILQLTPAQGTKNGSVFSTDLIDLTEGSFSTQFSFNFAGQINGGADGMVFTLQSSSNQAGTSGGGIGYQGINNSFGLEFDNYNNGAGDGYSDSHIGINFNGNINSTTLVTTDSLGFSNLDSPAVTWYAWLNYDNVTKVIDVFFNDQDILPGTAALSHTADLAAVLGTDHVYAGFTSATGGAYTNHNLLSWEFSNEKNGTSSFEEVPEPSSLFIFSAALLGLVRLSKKK